MVSKKNGLPPNFFIHNYWLYLERLWGNPSAIDVYSTVCLIDVSKVFLIAVAIFFRSLKSGTKREIFKISIGPPQERIILNQVYINTCIHNPNIFTCQIFAQRKWKRGYAKLLKRKSHWILIIEQWQLSFWSGGPSKITWTAKSRSIAVSCMPL